MVTRRLAVAGMAALLVLGAGACASGGGSGGGAASAKQLNVLMGATPDTDVIKKSIPAFEAATGIKVTLTEVPQDQLNSKLRLETQSNAGTYDVAGFQYELIPSYAKSLLPLDKYVTPADRSDITPSMVDAVSYGNHLYGQLYVATGQLLFYRKSLLAKAGVQVPKTWDEYVQAAQKLTAKDHSVWGTMVTAKSVEEPVGMYLNYLYQNGGDVVTGDKVTIADPPAVDALAFMVDLVRKEKVAPPGAANYWTVDTTNLFMQGKLATAPNWSYMYGVATAPTSKLKDDLGMAPLPCNQKCAISLGGWTLSAFKGTKRPDAAYKFIQFMTDKERQVKMALEGGNTPTRTSAIEDPRVKAVPLYGVMFESLKTAVPRSKYKNYPAIQNALSTAISAAVANTRSPEQALKDAATQIQSAQG